MSYARDLHAPASQDPDDLLLVSRDLERQRPWLNPADEVPVGRVLHMAALLGWSPAAVVSRLAALGHESVQDTGTPLPDTVEPGDAPLVVRDDVPIYSGPWLDINEPVSLRRVLEAACRTERAPADVAHRLSALGYRLGGGAGRQLPDSPDPADVMMILTTSRDFRKCLDWDDEMPAHHVFRAADLVNRRPQAVAARLTAMGFQLPRKTLDRLAEPVPGEPDVSDVAEAGDLVLLSQELDGRAPWLERNDAGGIPMRHVLRAALATGSSPADVAERLAALGHRLHENAKLPAVADDADIRLLAKVGRSYSDGVHLADVLRTASMTGTSPAEVASRLSALGYRLPDEVDYPDVRPALNGEWVLPHERLRLAGTA